MNDRSAGRVNIAGVDIDNVSFTDLVDMVGSSVSARKSVFIVTCNIDHVVKLKRDPEFAAAYGDAALVLPDGIPILWAAKFLGKPLKEKVSGSDILPKLCATAQKKGYRLFFLGGNPGSATRASEALKERHPGLQVVGVYSPPFGFEKDAEEDCKIVDMIKSAAPDILFVGLGAPKQEKWIHRHYKALGVPVSIGVGATFEFVAGVVRRAPAWMQRAGLEWLWRLAMEPKRLWRRYLVEDMEFFRLVLKQKLRR